jgi:hypothetical protein
VLLPHQHQISEGQRNQIIDHIRRYSQAVPRCAAHHLHGGSDDDDAGSGRFSWDEPAVDEVWPQPSPLARICDALLAGDSAETCVRAVVPVSSSARPVRPKLMPSL